MTNDYLPPLARPAFENFLDAEGAVLLAWDNVKAARTNAARKVALENFEDVQADARAARALYKKCERAAMYEPDERDANVQK